MNAYIWELVTQLIALHMTKHLPPPHALVSDCTSAIARTNRALSTTNDQLANKRGGIFASGAHQFANPHSPKFFTHIRGHPERDKERTLNPTLADKAICMADAAAGRTKAKLGDRSFPMHRTTLLLSDILPELIPTDQWYIRSTTDDFPVIGDLLSFQHKVRLHEYTKQRDARTGGDRWSSTAFHFANALNPHAGRSHWTATRRSIIAYDWLGHGRNRAKSSPNASGEELLMIQACRLCQQPDSQMHCMLDCPHPPFALVRRQAQQEQSVAYGKILARSSSNMLKYFVQQMFTASWTSTPNLHRIWLGTWNPRTLESLLPSSLDTAMSMSMRRVFIDAAKRMTKPLMKAYLTMLDITMRSPLNKISRPSTTSPIPPLLHNALCNTFPQLSHDDTPSPASDLAHLDNITCFDEYSLSDSARCSQHADDAI